jgi:hypothetical protein
LGAAGVEGEQDGDDDPEGDEDAEGVDLGGRRIIQKKMTGELQEEKTHEKENRKEKDDGLGFRRVLRTDNRVRDFARFRPKPAEREPQKSAADLMDKVAPREAATRIDLRSFRAI